MRTRLAVAFLGTVAIIALTVMVITTSSQAAVYDGTYCAEADVKCAGYGPPAGTSGACLDGLPCGGTCQTCNGGFGQSIRVCYAVKRTTPPLSNCAMLEGTPVPCGDLTSGTCRYTGVGNVCYCPRNGPVVGPCAFQQCEGMTRIP